MFLIILHMYRMGCDHICSIAVGHPPSHFLNPFSFPTNLLSSPHLGGGGNRMKNSQPILNI